MSSGEAPDVSIVLVSWNTASVILDAIGCVSDAVHPFTSEIIVVDNASDDRSVEVLTAIDDVTCIALETNTGFTHGANVGARHARGRHLLFLNPDVVAPAGSIAKMVEALEQAPEAWAVTPWFRNPDGTPQYFWRRSPGAWRLMLCFTRWGRKLDRLSGQRCKRWRAYRDLPDPPPRMEIDTVGAACLLMRQHEFHEHGGFDERYFNFFQDTDLARRMRRQERVLLGLGDVAVNHQLGVTFRSLPPWQVDAQMLRSLRQYLRGESWPRRTLVEGAIRFDLALPGPHRHERRAMVRAPLDAGT